MPYPLLGRLTYGSEYGWFENPLFTNQLPKEHVLHPLQLKYQHYNRSHREFRKLEIISFLFYTGLDAICEM